MARQALASCPELRELVFLPDAGADGLTAGEPESEAERTYAELLKRADDVGHSALQARMAELDAHDPINLQYTSGTTGFPKGATLTHHNILNNGYSIGELLGYTEHDRVVIPVPFYHCFGMVIGNLAALSHGAATSSRAGVRAGRGAGGGAGLRRTSLYGVPTMFIAELALPDFASYDLSTLRTGVMAGSLCPIEVMNRVINRNEHVRRRHLLRHDRTSPVSTHDAQRGHHGAADRDRGPDHAEPGDAGSWTRPRERCWSAARSASCAPAATRHARVLGPAGQDRRGDRRRRMDAHRGPRPDGRGRVPVIEAGSRTW